MPLNLPLQDIDKSSAKSILLDLLGHRWHRESIFLDFLGLIPILSDPALNLIAGSPAVTVIER
jgi:hypothetical protein